MAVLVEMERGPPLAPPVAVVVGVTGEEAPLEAEVSMGEHSEEEAVLVGGGEDEEEGGGGGGGGGATETGVKNGSGLECEVTAEDVDVGDAAEPEGLGSGGREGF